MKRQESHTPYHFDSFGPGLQDAIVYYHRQFSEDELEKLKATLEPLLRRKNRGTTMQFFLPSALFSEALQSLKNEIG